ncbi:succinylglutamate desuccinylase/aspartoacylase family protein [Bacilliculturomica massiliensis]|uniref:succinylglutamate desuccinylase/aspartoacylase family protein n=1 Tax=Bacilliculturomica massiliensis TaxID=1917867 RepID=UPI00102F49BE|nr:M14 family metallopeptidase [Bacilliculturomica massiliensis]
MNTFENFNLKEELAVKGRKVYGFIPLAQRPNGTWVNLPVMMAIGAEDGPTIVVDACAHGDEYEGCEGIIEAFRRADPAVMKGNLVCVPAVHAEAFAEMKRYSTLDFVPIDLNRTYPGQEKGYLTQSVADYYFNNIVKHADGLITIHGGGNYLYLEPVTLYQSYGDEISARSRAMAEAFGLDALWRNQVCEPQNGILDELAYTAGIPAITPEIGGQTTRATNREENVSRIADGVFNVLRLWKILDGEVKRFDSQYHVDVQYIYAKHGGIHKPQKKGGQRVKKGDTLSIITNLFGEEVDRVLSPIDGRVIGYWAYTVSQPRSWVYMVGRELEE